MKKLEELYPGIDSDVLIKSINAKPEEDTSNQWSFDVTFIFYEYEK